MVKITQSKHFFTLTHALLLSINYQIDKLTKQNF